MRSIFYVCILKFACFWSSAVWSGNDRAHLQCSQFDVMFGQGQCRPNVRPTFLKVGEPVQSLPTIFPVLHAKMDVFSRVCIPLIIILNGLGLFVSVHLVFSRLFFFVQYGCKSVWNRLIILLLLFVGGRRGGGRDGYGLVQVNSDIR